MKPDKLENILEFYRPRPIRTSKRSLYPRGFSFSPEFLDSFHLEFDKMVHEGCDPKRLIEHFSKAIRFHTDDERSQAVLEAKKHWQKKDKEKIDRRREDKEAVNPKQDPRPGETVKDNLPQDGKGPKPVEEVAQSCGTDKKGNKVCKASHSRGGPPAGTKVDAAGNPIK